MAKEVKVLSLGSSKVGGVLTSSSLGGLVVVDLRVLRDLDAMRSFHDYNLVLTPSYLDRLLTRYSIPVKFEMYVPQSGHSPF